MAMSKELLVKTILSQTPCWISSSREQDGHEDAKHINMTCFTSPRRPNLQQSKGLTGIVAPNQRSRDREIWRLRITPTMIKKVHFHNAAAVSQNDLFAAPSLSTHMLESFGNVRSTVVLGWECTRWQGWATARPLWWWTRNTKVVV